MCSSADCPVPDEPPPGETWCVYRLGLELARYLWGHDMRCGTPRKVTIT